MFLTSTFVGHLLVIQKFFNFYATLQIACNLEIQRLKLVHGVFI